MHSLSYYGRISIDYGARSYHIGTGLNELDIQSVVAAIDEWLKADD